MKEYFFSITTLYNEHTFTLSLEVNTSFAPFGAIILPGVLFKCKQFPTKTKSRSVHHMFSSYTFPRRIKIIFQILLHALASS